jgi:RNA polymerase sigma-70 factor (family 1)
LAGAGSRNHELHIKGYMNNYKEWDDAACLISFQQGNISAFEEIYNRYWFRLYSVAFKQTQSRQDAEEMIQTLFERIWKNRDQVIIKNVGAYLAVALRNIIIDHSRQRELLKKRMKPFMDTSLEANAGEEKLNHSELIGSVEEILTQLPEKTQRVFRLSRFEEKSVKEISTELQLSEKAVEYHISKSLKVLREYLKGYLCLLF